jgi:hypothetical protein
MSKDNTGWENALTVLQEVRPPFIPEGAEVKTVVADLAPGSAGFPPHRHSGPSLYYMLEGELQFELEGNWPHWRRPAERRRPRSTLGPVGPRLCVRPDCGVTAVRVRQRTRLRGINRPRLLRTMPPSQQTTTEEGQTVTDTMSDYERAVWPPTGMTSRAASTQYP